MMTIAESIPKAQTRLESMASLRCINHGSRVRSLPPFRPIVSSIGAYNYNLAKYLCNLLTPLIPAEFCAEDSFSFVNEIQKLSMHNNYQ